MARASFMPTPEPLARELALRKEQLAWATPSNIRTSNVIKDMRNEGPFPLWLDEASNPNKSPSMYEWSQRLEPTIRANFDSRDMSCITRAMLRFVRLGHASLDAMQAHHILEYIEEAEESGLLVIRPDAFFEQYAMVDAIGGSACAALLCVSTLQTIERTIN